MRVFPAKTRARKANKQNFTERHYNSKSQQHSSGERGICVHMSNPPVLGSSVWKNILRMM